jgi:hypothetical protein
MDWMPLVSVVIGAIIALAGSVGVAVWADKKREKREHRAALTAVLAEMRANLNVVAKPETMTRNVLVTYSDEAWKVSKGAISSAGDEIEENLHAAYADLALANAVAIQNLQIEYGRGYLNDSYRGHVRNMESGFKIAITQIEKGLKKGAD